ncbi:MAG: GNVR domain-containing protein, partial [Pseudomonadota bacterium]|nr:GNVR domain-containing protein [Pseudomonadota bacterium]
ELAQFISKLEEQISLFKQQHGRELPEYNSVNLQAVNRLTRDLEQNRMQLRSLKERKLYLEGQIATIDPALSSNFLRSDEGRLLLPPAEKLKALRMELLSLKSRYSDKHPDIRKTEREIAEIQAQNPNLAISADELTNKQEQLEKLQRRSKEFQARFGDKHPDRIQIEKEIAILRLEINNFTQSAQNQAATDTPETTTINNPAFINLQTQIKSTAMEIAATEAAYQQIKKNLTDFQTRLENAPLVERDYNRMVRNLDQAQLRYTDVTHKLTEAQVAQQMEESQQGERFKIIDPAQTPEKPFKPNRMAIALIGFVLALGLSTGVCALRENLDTSVKSVAELTRLTGVPVLSVTPIMENQNERRKRYWRYGLTAMLLLGLTIAALVAIQVFYMPFDILWIKVMRRLGI